ncbi:XRE family transcriptional regulator [Oceanobacillus piezotolerans]|uniref:XRE family transcriptional regulator n=1 Tax=Oceanobacillus piezotolerans TaxID=2448030 RepID=A0A498D6I9_9BACI|nr:helix-turn-helix transcriptional regulator [Oceanobacillus piezotolerans]RLL42764.1 XRE family transcriptional regulator [Oceanobacillus piezotolerans]
MIGDKIQKIRKSRGMTLSECAERANISKSYLSNIERNLNQNPSIQIIEKVALVLGVEVSSLISTNSTHEEPTESEWLDFVKELKESGVKTHHLQGFRTVIEFAKWQNEKGKTNI